MSILADVAFIRYLSPSIPLLILLVAFVINSAAGVHRWIRILSVILFLMSGQMGDYLWEIAHDYDGPCEGISRYLNEHGSPDDVVAITYGDMVLKFYTKMRIVGGFTGEPMEPAKDARWVIIRKYTLHRFDSQVKKYILNNIDLSKYFATTIDYPDTPWENRESPGAHLFETRTWEDIVVIYEKIK